MISTSNMVSATELKTKLNIIQNATKKKLENGQGVLTKTIVESNAEKGEATVEVKLDNKIKYNNDNNKYSASEVFIAIDDSSSMISKIDGYKNRKEALIESSKKLVNKLNQKNKDTKFGIVEFGYNAEVKLALTDNISQVISKLDELKKTDDQNTNIDADVYLANESFSKEEGNKIILLLTDGLATQDRQGNVEWHSSTNEKRITIAENTGNTIKEVRKKGTEIIALMAGLTNIIAVLAI